MFYGMKHHTQETIITLRWVVVIVGSMFRHAKKTLVYFLTNRMLFRAHKRLNLPTIRAKLIQTTINDLKVYFGSSLFNLQ